MNKWVVYLLIVLVCLAVCCTTLALFGRHWTFWQLTVLALAIAMLGLGLQALWLSTETKQKSDPSAPPATYLAQGGTERPIDEYSADPVTYPAQEGTEQTMHSLSAIHEHSVPSTTYIEKEEADFMMDDLNAIDEYWAKYYVGTVQNRPKDNTVCRGVRFGEKPYDTDSGFRMFWQCMVQKSKVDTDLALTKELLDNSTQIWARDVKAWSTTFSYVLTQTPCHALVFSDPKLSGWKVGSEISIGATNIKKSIQVVGYESKYVVKPTREDTQAALRLVGQLVSHPKWFTPRTPIIKYTKLSWDKKPEDLIQTLKTRAVTRTIWIDDNFPCSSLIDESLKLFQQVVQMIDHLTDNNPSSHLYEDWLCHPCTVRAFDIQHLLALIVYSTVLPAYAEDRGVVYEHKTLQDRSDAALGWLGKFSSPPFSKKCQLFAIIKIIGCLNCVDFLPMDPGR
jgi:hypothetical protein